MERETPPEGPDGSVMASLTRTQSLELLRRARIGRVVFSFEALPAVWPVSFSVVGEDVCFRLRGESRVAVALDGAVVAFEADELGPEEAAGWSVVVTGLAELVASGAESETVLGGVPRPWVPGAYDAVVRIRPRLVSGRRVTRPPGPRDEAPV